MTAFSGAAKAVVVTSGDAAKKMMARIELMVDSPCYQSLSGRSVSVAPTWRGFSLLSSFLIRKTVMDALVDADINHVVASREAIVSTRLLL